MHESIWQTSRYHTDNVPIPDDGRTIEVTIAGQQRVSGSNGRELKPLVIIEAGLGGVAEEHVIVAQLVASFARVLRYNRTGYGRSSLGTYQGPLSASHRAKELSLLLKVIELPPPYILVGQSFGGVFIRTFLEQRGKDDIVGMVFVDCLPHFQGGETLKEFKIFPTLSGSESEEASLRAIGLAQNVVLTPQQSEARKVAAQAAEQSNAEEKEFLASDESVIAVNEAEGALFTKDANGLITDIKFTKQPLGHGRLSVILGDFRRDLEAVLNYGKYHGYGDAELYRKTEELLELAKRTNWNFQKAMTALTAGDSKIRVADGTGRTHNLHVTRPDIVAEEVRWVMEGSWDLTIDKYWPSPQR